jgi:hypothetical protein
MSSVFGIGSSQEVSLSKARAAEFGPVRPFDLT